MAPFEIDLRLRTLDELFNSLDPSPLVERDIDDAIEDYMTDFVQDAPHDAPLVLVLHLPAAALARLDAGVVEESVVNYFSFLSDRQNRQLHLFMRESRRDALVGLIFLIACIAGSQAFRAFVPGVAGDLVSEGLIIIGWVANWRPVSAFLYDWRPAREKARIYARLASLSLQLREDVRPAPSPFPV
jgi:hypothetical protein